MNTALRPAASAGLMSDLGLLPIIHERCVLQPWVLTTRR